MTVTHTVVFSMTVLHVRSTKLEQHLVYVNGHALKLCAYLSLSKICVVYGCIYMHTDIYSINIL